MSAHTQQSSAPAPAQNPPPLTTDVVYSSSSPFTQELLLSLTSGHFGEQVVMSNAAETARMLLASSGVDTFVQSPDNRSTGKRAAPTEAQPAKRRRNPSEQQQQQEQPQPQLQQAAIISELLAAAPQIASAGMHVTSGPTGGPEGFQLPSALDQAALLQAAAAGAALVPSVIQPQAQMAAPPAAGEAAQALGGAKVRRRPQNAVPTRTCAAKDCKVQPSYNYPGEKKRLFCSAHRAQGMVNLCNKQCAEAGCTVSPRFNLPNCTAGKYCNQHKQQGMINVTDRRCEFKGCTKHPTYNYPGTHKRLYCAVHKMEGMTDMSHA